MVGEQHYQQTVLSTLLRWTLIFGIPMGVLNLIGGIFDPSWATPIGSGFAFMLALIAVWCQRLIQQGSIRRAARVYISTGMVIMGLVVCISAPSEILLGAMGLSVFVVLAMFFEPPGHTIHWGVISILCYEAGLFARLLLPEQAIGLRIDQISLYFVPPIILIFFTIIGRTMMRHLIGALQESEEARKELAHSYAEVEQRVQERTRDLVRERDRLDRALRELAIARDQAESASRAKTTFLATMSHELRTPLTAILGYTELIEYEAQRVNNTSILGDVPRIMSAGRHLLELINDVLDLTSIEADEMPLFAEPVLVERLVEDVVMTSHPLAEKNHNSIVVIYHSKPGEAILDKIKVRKILLNLLSNAAKFTHNGTITIEVDRQPDSSLPAAELYEQLIFRITDTGIGIPPEQFSSLFQPFVKGEEALKRVYSGTGLGLTICHRFCQLMHGQITVTSVVGEGSTFTVFLPVDHRIHRSGVLPRTTDIDDTTPAPTL